MEENELKFSQAERNIKAELVRVKKKRLSPFTFNKEAIKHEF